jgi:hypothetical protein
MAGVLLGMAAGAAQAAPGDLAPNLQTFTPSEVQFARTSSGQPELRFGNTVGNAGSGPLEIYSAKAGDCDGDASTANRYAYQRIFRDANGNGVFERAIDTGFTTQLAGCMVYHPAHHHWHFNDFAAYRLKTLVGGTVVSSSDKVTFCVVDSLHYLPSLPGSPAAKDYWRCNRTADQGISVGWADTYGASLEGQSLSLSGVPAGSYCLASTADPLNRLVETSDADNANGVVVNVTTGSASATGQRCT